MTHGAWPCRDRVARARATAPPPVPERTRRIPEPRRDIQAPACLARRRPEPRLRGHAHGKSRGGKQTLAGLLGTDHSKRLPDSTPLIGRYMGPSAACKLALTASHAWINCQQTKANASRIGRSRHPDKRMTSPAPRRGIPHDSQSRRSSMRIDATRRLITRIMSPYDLSVSAYLGQVELFPASTPLPVVVSDPRGSVVPRMALHEVSVRYPMVHGAGARAARRPRGQGRSPLAPLASPVGTSRAFFDPPEGPESSRDAPACVFWAHRERHRAPESPVSPLVSTAGAT